MRYLKTVLRFGFDTAEATLDRVFPAAWNPLLNLGALGFFFYWIITASGIYLYIFFDTGVLDAYASVEYITHEQWYLAGVMRSFHRYASDGLVIVMLLHLAREFARDRYRGVRWFSWASGIPVLILVYVAGISGYWLVWDQLAQYVATVSTEWLDRLAIFGESVANNFLSPDTLDSRFFTLMIFMHIAVPLLALGLLWLHLQRISRPKINPPRGLAVGTGLSLLVLSLVDPAISHPPADLARVPDALHLDWFYLGLYPLLDKWPGTVTWGASLVVLVIFSAMPWLPPLRRSAVARVDLDNCNGCARCFVDCPYSAISLVPRSDGKPFAQEPSVNPALCVACGICVGACPTAMPFRRLTPLIPGIDLPDQTAASLCAQVEETAAGLTGTQRVLIFTCGEGAKAAQLADDQTAAITLACIGQLPPAFIDYVLSRKLADGVILTGCAENSCQARQGINWTEQRLAGERDPHLRARVPRHRLRKLWAGPLGISALRHEIAEFRQQLEATNDPAP